MLEAKVCARDADWMEISTDCSTAASTNLVETFGLVINNGLGHNKQHRNGTCVVFVTPLLAGHRGNVACDSVSCLWLSMASHVKSRGISCPETTSVRIPYCFPEDRGYRDRADRVNVPWIATTKHIRTCKYISNLAAAADSYWKQIQKDAKRAFAAAISHLSTCIIRSNYM